MRLRLQGVYTFAATACVCKFETTGCIVLCGLSPVAGPGLDRWLRGNYTTPTYYTQAVTNMPNFTAESFSPSARFLK
jgi:hypothetical protein